MSENGVELVVDAHCQLGEGPAYFYDRLWWVDILGKRIHEYDPATGTHHAHIIDVSDFGVIEDDLVTAGGTPDFKLDDGSAIEILPDLHRPQGVDLGRIIVLFQNIFEGSVWFGVGHGGKGLRSSIHV